MNFRDKLTSVTLVLCLAPLYAFAQGSTDPWLRRSTSPKDFKAAQLPWNSFSIELPKNWQLVPGHGGILVTVAEKTRNNQPSAAIILEQMQLQDSLTSKDVDAAVAEYEVTAARQRDPAGQNFTQQVKQADGQRFIVVQYSRPGIYGLDRVVMYAIPAGRIMYRLFCIASAEQLTKYQETFAHVASSFKPSTQNTN